MDLLINICIIENHHALQGGKPPSLSQGGKAPSVTAGQKPPSVPGSFAQQPGTTQPFQPSLPQVSSKYFSCLI